MVEHEVKYAFDQLEKQDLNNEAAWVYLKGWLAQSSEEQERSLTTNTKKWFIGDFPWIQDRYLSILSKSQENLKNRFIYSLHLDYTTALGDKEEAKRILEHLKNIDRLRENYYQWRINQL